MKGRRKADRFRLYYQILFLINSTVSWSDEGIGLLGMRTIATSMSAAVEQANA
jgi:hypothetical protein